MNALHIMRREYGELVRKKSFIVSTILVPLFMSIFLVVPILLAYFVPDDQYRVAVLDHTGEVAPYFIPTVKDTLKNGEPKYIIEPGSDATSGIEERKKELLKQLEAGRLDIVLEIPATVFDDGKVDYITKDVRSLQIVEYFEDHLNEIVLKRRLAREGFDYERVASLTTQVQVEMHQITKEGRLEKKSFLSEWGLVFIFVMILYMALLTWGIAISRGILEEKGSRVIEVLLSSVEPRDLLLGKILGIGLAGLTQIGIWSVLGLMLSVYSGTAAVSASVYVNLSASVFLYFIVFFLLGFLFYASIFTVVGSICSTEQDAQQLQGLVTMPMLIPILVLMLIVESPNSTAAVVLSLIPPLTPMIMMGRIIVLQPPLWQIVLGLSLLVLSIYVAVVFSARVFRVGILMYGKRPSPREVIRWYRSAR